jgi:cholesterol oxidase
MSGSPAGEWDTIVVGSGFGGSVTALRRAERGDRVLVLEQGRRFAPGDFPRSNWDLRRYFWAPALGCRGPFRMSFFRHVTVLSGVGVGGGSLVYANTLPVPGPAFFEHGSWAGLRPWADELAPHYATARRMLGAEAQPVPRAHGPRAPRARRLAGPGGALVAHRRGRPLREAWGRGPGSVLRR